MNLVPITDLTAGDAVNRRFSHQEWRRLDYVDRPGVDYPNVSAYVRVRYEDEYGWNGPTWLILCNVFENMTGHVLNGETYAVPVRIDELETIVLP